MPNTPTGKKFVNWISDPEGTVFLEANNPNTSFPMPPNNVVIDMNFEKVVYKITISDGVSVPTTATFGDSIVVDANPIEGKTFSHWESDYPGLTFEDPNNDRTTFLMPSSNVVITAVFI